MLYVADHGESLGENNLYLHGLPYALAPDVQKHVPWITWLSSGFQQQIGVSARACVPTAQHRDPRPPVPLGPGHDARRHLQYRPALDVYTACDAA